VFTAPPGSVVVLKPSVVVIKILRDCVAVLVVVVSVTCTVKLELPVAVGVPEISPDVGIGENPVGREPAVMAQE
jgi:hypothetical protein